MAGLSELRNQALDKYDDDLNPIGEEGMAPEGMGAEAPAAPEGMPMGGEAPPMEDELGADAGGGEAALMADMLSEAGIEAAPEQVEAFIDVLKTKAMEMAEGPEEGLPEEGGMPPAEGGMPPEAPPMM